jgi:hypothetical protein
MPLEISAIRRLTVDGSSSPHGIAEAAARAFARARKEISTSRRAAATLTVALALAGCGGSSSNSNESKINRAKATEAIAPQIRATLARELHLHSYAGVHDAFTVPPGRPDVIQGEGGNECFIALVEASRDAVTTYQGSADVLISPHQDAVVEVVEFQGTSESVCLEAVRGALGW